MIIFTPISENEQKQKPIIPKYDGMKMSLEDFLASEIDDPGFKYEWNNGILEVEEILKPHETKIYLNLHTRFLEYENLKKDYEMISEVESHLTTQNKIRKPDIGIFSKESIRNYTKGASFFPIVAIEIISPSNQVEETEKKVKEYFKEGVKLVWHIFPKFKEVRIYYSPKNIKVCTDNEICDMDEVLSEYKIGVDEIF